MKIREGNTTERMMGRVIVKNVSVVTPKVGCDVELVLREGAVLVSTGGVGVVIVVTPVLVSTGGVGVGMVVAPVSGAGRVVFGWSVGMTMVSGGGVGVVMVVSGGGVGVVMIVSGGQVGPAPYNVTSAM